MDELDLYTLQVAIERAQDECAKAMELLKRLKRENEEERMKASMAKSIELGLYNDDIDRSL